MDNQVAGGVVSADGTNAPLLASKDPSRKPYTLAGTGPLTATVWKTGDEHRGWKYRFNVVRTNAVTGRVSQRFSPQDLRHLAKLIQVLAFTLADDGCFDPEIRSDLASLSVRLRQALEPTPSEQSVGEGPHDAPAVREGA